ncbi:hypothetical protein DTO164E3_2562 [Paecilomyces variotii]|nr:hypothetical protein DTO164E3_2562 [Paecilomyces variotii]KAJ9208616.1 hypothetical protein DTO032I3_593 [Paecilomyces variotii]KAJ9221479.1 hypothetical protein DTO169C6_6146 [Paecilomyces variotii]KAJ9282459.1 hypothetical protein DTO021D3_607 [Paecilomyces variotii]KAJ9287287.1 hypothetical protein DTO021C3_5205 [Paecilomyces variotii]
MGKGQRARLAATRERWRTLAEGIRKAETEIETRVPAASPPVIASPSLQSVAVMESVEHFPALPTCETSLMKKGNEEKEKKTAVEHVLGTDISEIAEKHDENKVDTTDKHADEGEEAPTAIIDTKAKDAPAPTGIFKQPATPLTAEDNAQSNSKKKQRPKRKNRFNNQRDGLKKKENRRSETAPTVPGAATAENKQSAEPRITNSTEFASVPFHRQYEQLHWGPLYPAAYPTTYHPVYPPYLSPYSGMGGTVRRNYVSQSSGVANITEPTYSHYLSPYSGQGGMARRHFVPQTSGAVNMNHYNHYSGLGGTARNSLVLPPPGFGNMNQYSPRRNRGSRFFPRERANENRNRNQAAAAESAQSAELRATAPDFVPSDKQT